jgi:hypothetical protein
LATGEAAGSAPLDPTPRILDTKAIKRFIKQRSRARYSKQRATGV